VLNPKRSVDLKTYGKTFGDGFEPLWFLTWRKRMEDYLLKKGRRVVREEENENDMMPCER
jgi:hypothetical protein